MTVLAEGQDEIGARPDRFADTEWSAATYGNVFAEGLRAGRHHPCRGSRRATTTSCWCASTVCASTVCAPTRPRRRCPSGTDVFDASPSSERAAVRSWSEREGIVVDLYRPEPADQRVRDALAALAVGEPVIVVDDADRENEGDLIFAAALATPALVAFTVRHTSGFVCVALPGEDCDRLELSPMHYANEDRYRTAYQVPVDLAGTGTGASASARAATIAALAAPDSTPPDFVRPGHVVPLRARPGGVLDRPGHTEAAVDLARLAGLAPVGALCEIVSQDRPSEMAHGAELERFAKEHDLVLLTVADLIRYRRRTEPQVRRVSETSLPTEHGPFRAVGFTSTHDGAEHVALVAGPVDETVPVYVHTECLSGDVLRSTLCACRSELDAAMARFSAKRRGIVVYLRPAGRPRACVLFAPTTDQDGPGAQTAAAEWILADLGACPAPEVPDPAARQARHVGYSLAPTDRQTDRIADDIPTGETRPLAAHHDLRSAANPGRGLEN